MPAAVLECQGSVLTNKYAEGYPGKRYYGGCEYVDVIEQLAIDRAKELFGAEHANVQPHAGAQANAAVYHALLQPGDTLMGLELAHGGHLSHGMKINVSGRLYDIAPYQVDRETSLIDMDEVQRLAESGRPKMILAGWSAYPRQLDFPRFREIADSVGAYLVVDMAHFAGLVAAGLHPNPVPYADVVTTTIHKTIGGGRGGMILCTEEHAKKINSAVFPGPAGRPARARDRGQGRGAADRRHRGLPGAPAAHARRRARRRPPSSSAAGGGVSVLTGGTDVHLVLCDLRESELDGQQAEDRLHDDRDHRQPQRRARSTRGRRRSPRVCGSAPRRWPPADCRPTTSSRSAASSPPPSSRTISTPAAPSWPNGPRRSPSATRCTRGCARPPFSGGGALYGGVGRRGRVGGDCGRGRPALRTPGAPRPRRRAAEAVASRPAIRVKSQRRGRTCRIRSDAKPALITKTSLSGGACEMLARYGGSDLPAGWGSPAVRAAPSIGRWWTGVSSDDLDCRRGSRIAASPSRAAAAPRHRRLLPGRPRPRAPRRERRRCSPWARRGAQSRPAAALWGLAVARPGAHRPHAPRAALPAPDGIQVSSRAPVDIDLTSAPSRPPITAPGVYAARFRRRGRAGRPPRRGGWSPAPRDAAVDAEPQGGAWPGPAPARRRRAAALPPARRAPRSPAQRRSAAC